MILRRARKKNTYVENKYIAARCEERPPFDPGLRLRVTRGESINTSLLLERIRLSKKKRRSSAYLSLILNGVLIDLLFIEHAGQEKRGFKDKLNRL